MPPTADALPDLRIRVDGADLRRRLNDDVVAVTVQEDLGAVSMVTIELHNWDQRRQRHTWSDDDTFKLGSEIEVSLGYVDHITPVMTAEVVGIEPSFVEGELPRVVVRGFDHGWRLHRARLTRTFAKQTDSEIAVKVARECGLRAQADQTKETHDYVLQANQTNWEFLAERAARNGYSVQVRDKTMHFRPLEPTGKAETIDLARDVWAFLPRLSGFRQPDAVTVRGWDVKKKQAISGSARRPTAIGGGRLGISTARAAYGGAAWALVTVPPASPAEAAAMADAVSARQALGYVTGELVCQGRPSIHVGDQVDVTGAGTRFSGRYLVTGVTHSLETAAGFRTRLQLGRNSA